MTRHELRLLGGPGDEVRVPVSVLLEALAALVEGARLATRFAIEGKSQRKGSRPAWLDAACNFDITGVCPGSVVLTVEAQTLSQVDPARFGAGTQQALFFEPGTPLGDRTAIDLFGESLRVVVEGASDDVAADRPLLEACSRFARVAGGSFAGVELRGLGGSKPSLRLAPEAASRIESLRDQTPAPQATRVAGILDTVSASRADLVVLTRDGARVNGRMEDHDLEALRALLGREVVVTGIAHYRPSGRLLSVDVESLAPARAEDLMFSRAPAARPQRVPADAARFVAETDPPTYFGAWPGEESDAALLAALRAIG